MTSDIGMNEMNQRCRGFHLVTAADITPDGKYILIKNHNNIEAIYSWTLYWERTGNESISETLKRQPQVIDCYQYEWQGEAICWLDNNTFYTTSDSDGEPPIYTALADDEKRFLPDIEGERYVSELQGTTPAGDIGFLKGIEDLGYGVVLRGSEIFRGDACKSIQFLIVVIFDFGVCLQECFAFAHQVLSATYVRARRGFWLFRRFRPLPLADLIEHDDHNDQYYE